jgi:hypothetical protein
MRRAELSRMPVRAAVESRRDASKAIPHTLALLFAPVHKRALGTAVGFTAATGVFLLTAFHLLVVPESAIDLSLLAQYFHGYTVSWSGAFIGAFWGFVTGFVAGWFVGFVRNVVMAASMFIIRTRAELLQAKDFLDHI